MSFRTHLISFTLFCFSAFLGISNHASAQTLEILPLGNSVTRGSMCFTGTIWNCANDRMSDGDAIGYRLRLKTLLSNAGYSVDYQGSQKYGYNFMNDFENAGFSGIREDQLADVIETGYNSSFGQITPGPYMNYFPADIVLLHIGTNDVMAGDYNSVAGVERILNAIDAYETANNRPILVLISKIISQKGYPCSSHYGTTQYNNRLVSMAQSRINNGDKLVIVDMECGAGINYYNDLIDEAHPNQNGYDKMADKWFEVINSFNTAPVLTQIPDQGISQGASFTQIHLDSYVYDAEDPDQNISWSFYPYNPEHLSITIDANRIATITPLDPDWTGSETIEFVAMDQGKVITALQKTDNCLTRFSVDWVPEIIGQQPLSTPEKTPLTITLDDLIIEDMEGASGSLQLVLEAGTSYTVAGPILTPADGFIGELTVPVKVMDGDVESNTYNLSVTVTQVNYPPVITSVPVISGKTSQEYLYQMAATDPDPGDVLSYSASEKPQWLNVNPTTGLVSGTPSSEDAESFPVTLLVSDGSDEVSQSYVLQIEYVNNPPEILTVPEDTALVGETYTYGIQAEDPEGEVMTYFADELPDWLTFYPSSKVLIGSPGRDDAGNHLISLGVSDNNDTTYQAYELHVPLVIGIDDSNLQELVRVYPNPASTYVVIEIEDDFLQHKEGISLELFNLSGARILHTVLTGSRTEIDLGEFGINKGLYMFRLTEKEKGRSIKSGKIVVH